MKPKYLWPVLLGLAAGCAGGADTPDESGDAAATESAGSATEGSSGAKASEGSGTTDANEESPATPPASTVERDPAPDFELNDLNDEKVTLSALKGKVVLLVFWGID